MKQSANLKLLKPLKSTISLTSRSARRYLSSDDLKLHSKPIYIPYKDGVNRSNAKELIHQVPPIVVDGHVAVCDGGGGALGHPLEYIQLDTYTDKPQVCKYCGLRFIKSHGH